MIAQLLRSRRKAVPDLETARLRLVAITPQMLQADAAGGVGLGRALRANITAEWPPEHWEPSVLNFILQQYQEEPDTKGWHRFVLHRSDGGTPTLIGCVGGFPRADGEAEIAYSTLPAFQRKGFATEAIAAFISYLLTQERVRGVTAQTFPHLHESIKVMERCGMKFAGDGYEKGTVCYRKMRAPEAVTHQR